MAARSYKNEVIILISEMRRLDTNLQAWYSLKSLGIGHVLFISTDPQACRAVSGGAAWRWAWPPRTAGSRGRLAFVLFVLYSHGPPRLQLQLDMPWSCLHGGGVHV